MRTSSERDNAELERYHNEIVAARELEEELIRQRIKVARMELEILGRRATGRASEAIDGVRSSPKCQCHSKANLPHLSPQFSGGT